MKKLFTLVAVALCAIGSNAQDYNYTLPADAQSIDQTLIDQIAADAQGQNAVITIPGGITVNVNGVSEDGGATGIKVPEGLSLAFVGEGDTKPVLKFPKSLDIAGTHSSIRFENVDLVDDGCQYVINQSAGTNTDELSFKNITMDGMSRSLVRLQSSEAHNIGRIVLDDCVITNQGSGAYPLFYFNNAAYTVGELTITNSTFATILNSFVSCAGANIPTINISDCTFYDIIGGSGKYFVDANGNSTNINLKNLVLGKTNTYNAEEGTSSSKGIRTNGETVIENVYQAADCVWSSNKFSGDIAGKLSSVVFTAPEDGDFTLTISEKIGDPRWYAGESDGIGNISVEKADANAPAYNLAGQKVGYSFKGVVVRNGKKIVRK